MPSIDGQKLVRDLIPQHHVRTQKRMVKRHAGASEALAAAKQREAALQAQLEEAQGSAQAAEARLEELQAAVAAAEGAEARVAELQAAHDSMQRSAPNLTGPCGASLWFA